MQLDHTGMIPAESRGVPGINDLLERIQRLEGELERLNQIAHDANMDLLQDTEWKLSRYRRMLANIKDPEYAN